jgi:hypothetical protein
MESMNRKPVSERVRNLACIAPFVAWCIVVGTVHPDQSIALLGFVVTLTLGWALSERLSR